ncbi:MAG TPA: hypothetical protein VKQ70_12165 [Caulobacteraceae bacterium]|nr:hypothetical protein [Caulobacteraceae bacterium]
MNTPSWMMEAVHAAHPKPWARRNRGRRANDRQLSLESILTIGVVLAWAWGVYEVTLLFLK